MSEKQRLAALEAEEAQKEREAALPSKDEMEKAAGSAQDQPEGMCVEVFVTVDLY